MERRNIHSKGSVLWGSPRTEGKVQSQGAGFAMSAQSSDRSSQGRLRVNVGELITGLKKDPVCPEEGVAGSRPSKGPYLFSFPLEEEPRKNG